MQKDHWNIDKYNHTKEHKYLSEETLMWKKTQQNFLCIRCIKSTRKYPKQVRLPPADIYLSFSYALYTSECVFKWGTQLLYLYSFCHLNFNLTSQPHLTDWVDFT